MPEAEKNEQKEAFADQVKGAVMWRSGSQIAAQLLVWASTFIVIRLLDPSDYGLFAMAQVVLNFLALMSGYGFANALVRNETISKEQIAQVFGMLVLLNGALALGQLALAPLAAAYFHQPLVADLLRVLALLFLAGPFIALPRALLARQLNFKAQAQVHLVSSLLSAATALGCAAAGWGVWSLAAAAFALFYGQAIGMTIAARSLVWPSFRFRGTSAIVSYGSAMVVVQLCWFIMTQSDVFIAGRVLDAHSIGLYTTALFLTQILTGKFIPPLNEVAFAAYSRLQGEPGAIGAAFCKAVRLIMLVALPFYFGLAAAAEPLVLTLLGAKWAEAVPLAGVLALGMPFLTLQILFTPAINALGRARLAVWVSAIGAVLMPAAFLIGIQYGAMGIAYAWLVGLPIFAAGTAALALPVIGVKASELARSLAPGLSASGLMGFAVLAIDGLLPPVAPPLRLAILVGSGAAVYGALLFALARPQIDELIELLPRRRRAAA